MRAHRLFGGAIGGGHRIEMPGRSLVVDADGGAEKRQDGLAGDRGKLFDECRKIDCRHVPAAPRTDLTYRRVA